MPYAISDVTDKAGNILATAGDINGLVDYVFLRLYDDDIKEVVIIKAYDYGRLYYNYEY